MRYLPLLLLVAAVACVKEPVAWYYDVGVIDITSDSTTVTFSVPDNDTINPGWNPWSGGEASKDLSITLKEKAKKDVAVTALVWDFYDVNDNLVATRSESYVPPLTVEAGKEYTYTVSITVSDAIADDLDDADGAANDFSGDGTIEFNVYGYDLERGEDINSIPSFTPIHVQK